MLIRASLALFFRQFSTQSTTAGSIEDDQLLDVSSDWSLVAGCLSSGPPVPPAWRETGVTLLELYWIQASSESKKKMTLNASSTNTVASSLKLTGGWMKLKVLVQ